MRTRLIITGGFLGSGKTTLLLQASRLLTAQGYRVGIVTNDQGEDLVDTALAAYAQIPVTEVAGGCFCCRFPDLLVAFNRLRESVEPDVVLAEPVGSCTDLMATVLLPLQRYYSDQYDIAPLAVLLDATRDPGTFAPTVEYLFRQQLAEAEVLVVNKMDLLSAADAVARMDGLRRAFPVARVLSMSAQAGDGVADWLSIMMSESSGLASVLDLDYEQYADAEASLGWLNAKLVIRSFEPFAADTWLADLLRGLGGALAEHNAQIAHIKATVIAPTVQLKASLTEFGKPPYWDMWSPHAETDRAQVILNARVHTEPRILEESVRRVLDSVRPHADFHCEIVHFECFRPAPPRPTHRLGREVLS